MKKSIFILFVLAASSCEEKGVRKPNELYREWEWEATLFLNGNVYRSEAALDSTYYYDFKDNGILEIKDKNKAILYEEKFEITENERNRGIIMRRDVNNSEWHYSYSIESNELRIANVEGFLTWINVYKSTAQQKSKD